MAVRVLLQCFVLLAIIGCCSCAGPMKSHGDPQNLQIHPFGNETDGEEEETKEEEAPEEHGELHPDEHPDVNDTARHSENDECWFGRGFTTVEKCLHMCNDPEAVDETSSGDVKAVALYLKTGEFQVKNNKLTVKDLKHREFEESQFRLSADRRRALVCLDLSDKFKACNQWELEENEFELQRNFSISVKAHEEVHDFGSYLITKKNSAVVCQNEHAVDGNAVTQQSTATEKTAGSGAVALFPQLTVTMIILWEMLAIIVPFL